MDHNSYRYAEPIAAVTVDAAPREHFLETIAGRAIGLAALIAMFAVVGGFDYADQVAAEAKAKQDRAARMSAYADMYKDRPIRISDLCSATISDGMTSVTMREPRCVRVKESK